MTSRRGFLKGAAALVVAPQMIVAPDPEIEICDYPKPGTFFDMGKNLAKLGFAWQMVRVYEMFYLPPGSHTIHSPLDGEPLGVTQDKLAHYFASSRVLCRYDRLREAQWIGIPLEAERRDRVGPCGCGPDYYREEAYIGVVQR